MGEKQALTLMRATQIGLLEPKYRLGAENKPVASRNPTMTAAAKEATSGDAVQQKREG